MRRLYKEYFGSELPNLKELVVDNIKPRLQELSKVDTGNQLCPLVALAHGDLNAANIMIDALDAVWLIDFATSVDLPLFTDMCKFEMACLFEYSTIPVTPQLLLEFATKQEETWTELQVGEWLKVDVRVATLLMQRLVALPAATMADLTQNDLDKLIDDVVSESAKPHKQKGTARALKARIMVDQNKVGAAFDYCKRISDILLQGDYIKDSLDIRDMPLPEGAGAQGASSLRFFMSSALLCAVPCQLIS
jgi:hypothetical protein